MFVQRFGVVFSPTFATRSVSWNEHPAISIVDTSRRTSHHSSLINSKNISLPMAKMVLGGSVENPERGLAVYHL